MLIAASQHAKPARALSTRIERKEVRTSNGAAIGMPGKAAAGIYLREHFLRMTTRTMRPRTVRVTPHHAPFAAKTRRIQG